MNSLIEDKQILTNDPMQELTHSMKKKLLLKPYSFFVFYKVLTNADKKIANLEKVSLRLKEDKSLLFDKYFDKNQKNEKLVNIFFVNLDLQNELEASFLDLKFQLVQNKTKIILLGYESDLLRLIQKTSQFGIDIKAVPFAIYSPALNNDLSLFLGWNQQLLGNLAQKSPDQLSILANQWISSPFEKVDVWQVHFQVKPAGKISKLQYDLETQTYLLKEFSNLTEKKQYFISHFSIGYHSKMFISFQTSKKIEESSFLSKIKFDFEGFKKFCCVGNQTMKSSTGIVNISYKNQQNTEMQIMKEFYDKHLETAQSQKYKHNRKVLSIVLANIDIYHGQKLSACRVNDEKIQLLSFGAQKQYQKIGSIGGQIKLRFQTEQQVCVKIGNSCFLLSHPIQAIVKPYTKMKALINKEMVGC